jgi:MraZ protein
VDQENPSPVLLEAPRGTYPARVDDKGRLKLPANFQGYLTSLPEKKLFVTSVDEVTARVYPITVWRANEKLFEEETEFADEAADILFIANRYGSDCEMDAQGRVLFSPELRRKLGLENQPVFLIIRMGVVEVYSEATFQSNAARASTDLAAKLTKLRKKKMK